MGCCNSRDRDDARLLNQHSMISCDMYKDLIKRKEAFEG